jgi:nicotinamidase-related amidase
MPIHQRLIAADGALLVVDVQERLLPAIHGSEEVLARTLFLARTAKLLAIPTFATEQYPQGLGPTVPELAELIPDRPAKLSFHAALPELVDTLLQRRIRHVTLAGIETHVCVAQTALELLRIGLLVQVATDAVGSRFLVDHDYALRRLESAGAILSTAEAIAFEWLETAQHPRFKEVSSLVKSRTAVGG